VNPGCQEILSGFLSGIQRRKGLIGLVGEAGSGKTTLLNAVLERLDKKTKTAFLFNFALDVSFDKMLSMALVDLGVAKESETLSLVDAIQRLNNFALQQLVSGGNVVFIMDEAQNLNRRSMEKLRLLSNLETRKQKLVQILLVGQSELRQFLAAPGLSHINERITSWFHLRPLAQHEVGYYVRHRLTVAGNHGTLSFSKEAIQIIYRYCRGNPRKINSLCDRSLLIACCNDEFTIDRRTILRAIDDIEGSDWECHPKKGRALVPRIVPVAAAVLIGFAISTLVGGGYFRSYFSDFFSTVEKVASVQNKAFLGGAVGLKETTVKKTKKVLRKVETPVSNTADLLFDKQASLVKLFRLFDVNGNQSDHEIGDVYPGLFSLQCSQSLYRKFQKPFRIRVRQDNEGNETGEGARYLLVKEVTDNGVLALGRQSRPELVTDDFIASHWDGEVSWVYPYQAGNKRLAGGMNGPKVSEVQIMLKNAGYNVMETGVFDSTTYDEVKRFQRAVGNKEDGVVGTRTRGRCCIKCQAEKTEPEMGRIGEPETT